MLSSSTWVKNLPSTSLTEAQECLLAHRSNLAKVPKCPPNGDYIMAIEHACSKLNQGKAEELRVEVKNVFNKVQLPKTKIKKEEMKAMKELKEDNTRMVLTTDKGVVLVVIDKKDYIKKAEYLLNQPTYKLIPADPTIRQKTKLINLLKNIKAEGSINEETYKRMYPTGAGSPKFYELPKIHKPGTPLRPTVSSWGTVTYGTAKELTRILKSLVGMSPYHVLNTRDFVQHLKDIGFQQDECIISYNVKALFTSVPIHPAINIKSKLSKGKDLQERTSMAIHHIISLLEFCPKNTYFVFQSRNYEHLEGTAIGSPIIYIVANLYMEEFEAKALVHHHTPPSLWKRFVDDTLVVINSTHREEFLKHINSIDEGIQFTAENTKADGSMPFLDIFVIPQSDGCLSTTVIRKPTNTDQYLQWVGHHAISAEYSVISTQFYRAKAVCSTSQHLHEEHEHQQKDLTGCKYPRWALDRIKNKINAPVHSKDNNNKKKPTNNNTNNNTKRNYIVLPYTKGLSEGIKYMQEPWHTSILKWGQDHQRPPGGTQR